MLTDMIAAYVYAASEREKKVAERNCRRLGIDKRTLSIMAEAFLEDSGVSVLDAAAKGNK